MTGYVLRRLASSALLLLLIVTLTFVLLHLAPGNPFAGILADPRVPAGHRAHLERLYGLDRPLAVQYVDWLAAAVRGDWGVSISLQRPVSRVIADALPATALLALSAIVVEYLFAVPLGIWAARRRGTATDHLIRGGSLVLYSIPSFWFALMAILLFSYLVPIFPPSHMHAPDADRLSGLARLVDLLHHLALPALVLGLSVAGGTARFVRAGMIEVLGQDYIRTARAKGLGEGRVLVVHALRNALTPLLQLLGLSLPLLLNGSLVTEVIFSWPGLGQTTFQAILARDYPVILAATVWGSALVIAGNLAADLLQAASDPRVRHA